MFSELITGSNRFRTYLTTLSLKSLLMERSKWWFNVILSSRRIFIKKTRVKIQTYITYSTSSKSTIFQRFNLHLPPRIAHWPRHNMKWMYVSIVIYLVSTREIAIRGEGGGVQKTSCLIESVQKLQEPLCALSPNLSPFKKSPKKWGNSLTS